MSYPKGFSRYNLAQRLAYVQKQHDFTHEDMDAFRRAANISHQLLAEQWIENAIGCMTLPLGVVPSFVVDGVERMIPMAVEESSVVAALSKAGRLLESHGALTTCRQGKGLIGQVQLMPLGRDAASKALCLLEQKLPDWVDELHKGVLSGLCRRGGGVEFTNIKKIKLSDQQRLLIIEICVDTCDAMGANIVTQACEQVKKWVQLKYDLEIAAAIVSNYADHALTIANVSLKGLDPALAKRIEAISLWAQHDVHRACTHNKGIMNAVDAVLLATGNDWRAVEAGMHAYAAHQGRYTSLTEWSYQQGVLQGTFKAPITVGTVAGVTSSHPLAKRCLAMLKVQSAESFSRLLAAVGLMQNFSALMALAGNGLAAGHMKLHIRNWLIDENLNPSERTDLQLAAEAKLKETGFISQQDIGRLSKRLFDVNKED